MASVQPASSRIQVLEVIGNSVVGGTETAVARLIERLPAQRFGVSVLCPFESPYTDQLRGLGAEVHIASMPEDPDWSAIQYACALVKAKSIDVIHSHLSNAHLLAGLAGRLAGKPVLATIHGRKLTTLDLEVHRIAGTHVAVVCNQSRYHALGIGVAPTHLHCIVNGVDTDRFAPRNERSGPLRRRFRIPADAKVVGFVGRLAPEKAPDVFLRMALAVHQASPETHFLLVGDGTLQHQLQTSIAHFGLDANVHLAGMADDVPAVMNELDILVSSSHSEAMPLALMEAMASGLPVVATRVGGVPELVQHGTTGWLANDGDYDGLASRVLELLRDDALRLHAGQSARRRAVERMSLAHSVAATARLLTRLAQPRASEPRISAVASDGKLVGAATAPDDRALLG